MLLDAKVQIAMDGRGRWIDNRIIERLSRSVNYECVYLNVFETGSEVRKGLALGSAITVRNVRTHRVGCCRHPELMIPPAVTYLLSSRSSPGPFEQKELRMARLHSLRKASGGI